MKGAPNLESADALVVLAFEEQTDLWMCRSLPFPWSTNQCVYSLRRGGEGRKCCRRQYWGKVYVYLDLVVRGLDRGACKWEGLFNGRHWDCRAGLFSSCFVLVVSNSSKYHKFNHPRAMHYKELGQFVA